MSTDEAVVADVAVVTHLTVVVEFGATLDDSVGSDTAVDATKGADLHVVGDDHTAKRLELFEAFVAALEIITVRSDDATRMDDDVVADHAVVIDGHVGVDEAVLPDDGVMAHKRPRHDERALPYLGRVADGLRLRLEGAEMTHNAQEGIKRVGMQQQGLAFRTDHFLVDKDHRCGRVEGLGVVFRVVDKGDVTRLHLVDFVQACYREVGGANVFSVNKLRNSFQCSLLDFHRLMNWLNNVYLTQNSLNKQNLPAIMRRIAIHIIDHVESTISAHSACKKLRLQKYKKSAKSMTLRYFYAWHCFRPSHVRSTRPCGCRRESGRRC